MSRGFLRVAGEWAEDDARWRRVDRERLLEFCRQEDMVRWCTDEEHVVAVASPFGWAWAHPWRPGGAHWGGVAVLDRASPPEAESAALRLILRDLPIGVDLEWFSTVPGRALAAPRGYTLGAWEDWAFYATQQMPVAEPTLPWVLLDDTTDADELARFGHAEHPDFQGFPGRGIAYRWYGLRGHDGGLIAIGSLQRLATGVPHLGGIVVRSQHRGQGIGTDLMRLLTREALAESGVATLGVLSSNAAARVLYDSMGFHLSRRMVTRALTRTEPAEDDPVPDLAGHRAGR